MKIKNIAGTLVVGVTAAGLVAESAHCVNLEDGLGCEPLRPHIELEGQGGGPSFPIRTISVEGTATSSGTSVDLDGYISRLGQDKDKA